MEKVKENVMEEVEELIKKLVGKKYVRLVDRGNTAIKIALKVGCSSGGDVIVPDQGGWITYLQYPKKLGLKMKMLETDAGVIDADGFGSMNGCLLYTNMAGYFAEQNIDEIYSKFDGNVILDICSLGLRKNWFADIIIGSFGRWKVVDAEYGGFIATDDVVVFDKIMKVPVDFDEGKTGDIKEKLVDAKKRLKFLMGVADKIKKELSDFDIIHRARKGINVVVRFSCDDEKQKILKYCKSNGYEYTLCPRYIRVNEDAISIEVKRVRQKD